MELAVYLYASPVNPFPGNVKPKAGTAEELAWQERTIEGLYVLAEGLLEFIKEKEKTSDLTLRQVNQNGQFFPAAPPISTF